MIPSFDQSGNLPPGIYRATWDEIMQRFGNNDWRLSLLRGMHEALAALRHAGCSVAYLDGSFTTRHMRPADYDCCWDVSGVSLKLLDPVLMDFKLACRDQKMKYGGEFFPILPEPEPEITILEWFQSDKQTGKPKGIIAIDLESLS